MTSRSLAGQWSRLNVSSAGLQGRGHGSSAGPEALWLGRRLLRRAVGVPEAAQTWRLLLLLSEAAAVARANLRLLDEDGLLLRGGLGIRGKPGREGAALFRVVAAEDAADVRVVFGVAVGFAGKRGPERRDLRRCLGEEVGVPRCHGVALGGGKDRRLPRTRFCDFRLCLVKRDAKSCLHLAMLCCVGFARSLGGQVVQRTP